MKKLVVESAYKTFNDILFSSTAPKCSLIIQQLLPSVKIFKLKRLVLYTKSVCTKIRGHHTYVDLDVYKVTVILINSQINWHCIV